MVISDCHGGSTISLHCGVTKAYSTIANPAAFTAAFTHLPLPPTNHLPNKPHPNSTSFSTPPVTLLIQVLKCSPSYLHQPSPTFPPFFPPFKDLLSHLCFQLPMISSIIALPPITSRNFLLSQLNLFDSFTDHPGYSTPSSHDLDMTCTTYTTKII
jgi:hypothetical protein